MSGWKDWQIGEVVTEGDFQSLVQDQVVQRYADSTARDSTLGTAVAEGMVSYLDDTNKVEVYDGTAWTDFSGDITGVTAGTGLSGGGTAGDVTLSADYAAIGSAITVDQDQVTGLTSGTQGYTALSNGTAGISYQPVSHNYIINGAFDVWQRGDSGSGFGYVAPDRWRTINSCTVTKSTDTPNGQIAYSAQVTANDSGGFRGISQRVESNNTYLLSGSNWTVSMYVKANAQALTNNASIGLQTPTAPDNYASVSSLTTTTLASLGVVADTWTRVSITRSDVIANGLTINIFPNGSGTTAAGTIYITGVQLEAGSVATPFKRHAPSLQGELAACQRYYFSLNGVGAGSRFGNANAVTTSAGEVIVYFPTTMRIPPTSLRQSGTASDYSLFQTAPIICSAVPSHISSTTNTSLVSFAVSAALTIGNTAQARAANANAFLAWEVEL